MQAMLIATGEDPKLLPLTTTMPSPMVPIVDRPVMVHAIELLARSGIRDIYVSLYDQASTIENYCGHGERWSVQLHFLLQRTVWGTAGSLKRAEPLLTETFLVLPADMIIDLDIEAALRFHQSHGGIATAILAPVTDAKQAVMGLATVDQHGRLQASGVATTAHNDYCYTGAFIFEPSVLHYIPPQSVMDCHSLLMSVLRQAKQAVYGYVMDSYWNPLTTFSDYHAAQLAVLDSLNNSETTASANRIRHPYIEAGEIAPGIWVGPNSIIHPTARLTPPLFIGAGCRIGRDTELGPATVIGAGVVLDEGVTIQQSTVLPHTYVGQFLHLAERIAHRADLIDTTTGTNVQIADPWLLTGLNPTLVGSLLRNLAERVFALLLLGVLAPFLFILGIALWVTAGGPVVTRVQRFGQMPLVKGNPQLLKLYQFKTRQSDNRLTTVGKWLESWEGQRLPELWNVVQGKLSLVGVRPLSFEDTLSLQETWQQGRFGAPAGFTGLWYTQAAADADADELCIMDAYQAATHTWRDDLRQLWLTPGAWLKRLRQARLQKQPSPSGHLQLSQTPSIQVFYNEQENHQRITVTRHEQATHLLLSPSDQL